MKEVRKYIAYGSNLNVEQMNYRCPDSKVICKGVIKDYKLLFKGSMSGNYLTIEPAKGYEVPVVIWAVSESDEHKLDIYEGWPRFYRKETLPVETEDGVVTDSFAYIMNGHELGAPTNRYFNTCLSGYRSFGFNPEILVQAVNESMK